MPQVDIGDISIQVAISSITATKLNEDKPKTELIFDVSAKLEEKERKSGQVTVVFLLTLGTKPNIAKFGIEGYATLTGKDAEIEKQLEIDPDTKIPRMLYAVYQRLFMALYLAATLLETPYPPPDLFHTSKQARPIEIAPNASITPPAEEQAVQNAEAAKEPKQ